jgi:hypothetical protein
MKEKIIEVATCNLFILIIFFLLKMTCVVINKKNWFGSYSYPFFFLFFLKSA